MSEPDILLVDHNPVLEKALTARGQRYRVFKGAIRPLATSSGACVCVFNGTSFDAKAAEELGRLRSEAPHVAVVIAGDAHHLEMGADAVLDGEWFDNVAERLREVAQVRWKAVLGRPHQTLSVLVVGVDPIQAALIRRALEEEHYRVNVEWTVEAAYRRLLEYDTAVLIAPAGLRSGGVGIAAAVRMFDAALRVVVISDQLTNEEAFRALTEGAADYLLAPVGKQQVLGAVCTQFVEFCEAARGRPNRRNPVLFVESSPGRGSLIEQMLSLDSELKVTTATGTAAATGLAAGGRFSAIVWQAPALASVPDAMAQLAHVMRAFPTVPVVVVAPPSKRDLERWLQCGVEDVITSNQLGVEALASRLRIAMLRYRLSLQRTRFVRDLRRREASHRRIIEQSLHAFIVIDAGGDVAFSNPRANDLFGKGEPLWGMPATLKYSLTEALEVNVADSRSGEQRILEVKAAEIDWLGSKAVLVSALDVTERRNAASMRERLGHQDRLAAIGQLAAGIAHEINNPASYVVANLRAAEQSIAELATMLETAPGQARSVVRELEQMTQENLDGMNRIRQITGDLKTFARIESSDLAEVDLNDCVDSACKIAASALKGKARVVVDQSPLPQVTGSGAKLAQVVINLLLNAAQAITEGAPDQNKVLISTTVEGSSVVLTVDDTGTGVPREIWGRIFDPFFTTKPRDEGTGLGLAMCADIVRLHGGSIEVSDSMLGGARFVVSLPIRSTLRASIPAPPVSRLQRATLSSQRVLLVDDELLVLRSFARMLTRHSVTTALGAKAALEIIRAGESFDVILCDLMMPGLDGPDFAEILNKERPDLGRRILFCSGGAFTERVTRYLDAVRPTVLEKPLTLEAFERAVLEMEAVSRLRLVR